MIVAIDGPAGSGKGTLAKSLGQALGYAVLDTGLIYRAVGLKAVRAGADPADPQAAGAIARALTPQDLDDPELRSEAAARAASETSAIPVVREALVAFQRDFARHPPGGAAGAILDGRDIGTQICPDAEVKLFVDARPEVRAARRAAELRGRGQDADEARILRDMRERDTRDRTRAVAPLRPADDARVIDTSDMTAQEVLTWALDYIKTRSGSGTD